MKYIKTYEAVAKPEVDENTIRVEKPSRGWYIDFYFDEKYRLIYIDNKWHIKMPDWYQFYVNLKTIKSWVDFYFRGEEGVLVYKILEKEAEKYNL